MTSAAFVKTAVNGDASRALSYLKDQLWDSALGSLATGAQIRDDAFASGWTGIQLAMALNSLVRDDGVQLDTLPQLAQLAQLVGVYDGDFWYVATPYSGPPPAQGSDDFPENNPGQNDPLPPHMDPIPILTEPDPLPPVITELPDVPGDNGPRLPPIIYNASPGHGKNRAAFWIGAGLLAWALSRGK